MNDPISSVRLRQVNEQLCNSLEVSDQLIDGIQRGLDMIERLKSSYKPEDKLPEEVISYIQDYEDACEVVGWESIQIDVSCESAWDVVKSVCRSLWGMLMKLWDRIKHCFRWLFNAQYRASSNASKYYQKAVLLDSSQEHSSEFERYETPEEGMIPPEDLKLLIASVNKIVDLTEQVKDLKDAAAIDAFVVSNVADCGLVFKNNRFEDTMNKLNYKSGSYGTLGWNAKILCEVCKLYTEATRRTVVLRKFEKDLDLDVSELKRKMNNLAADGADVSEVQKLLAWKLKLYTIIQAAQTALSDRITVIDGFLESASTDAQDICDGTYKEDNDDE